MIYVSLFISSVLLFLFSIKNIIKGFEYNANDYLKNTINKLTKNKYIAIIYGFLICAILQSSSLVTVVLITLIQTKKIKLIQAVWILLGANIGTTITNQLIILDLKILIPFCLMLGLWLIWTSKSYYHIGKILTSLSILVISIDVMKYAASPIANHTSFLNLITNINSPIVAFFLGLIMTAILQSSTASIAIIQTLVLYTPISINILWWIIFGQNIGTCFTGLLACYNTDHNAKKIVFISFLINTLGIVLFLIFMLIFDVNHYILLFSNGNPLKIIANMHSIYNLIAVIMLIPLDIFMVNVTNYILE